MSVTNLSLFSMLKTRMHWHQERQRLLAENVANASSPNYRPRDLAPPKFERTQAVTASLGLERTASGHMAASVSAGTRFRPDHTGAYEARPTGNSVVLEDEMMKVAQNQMDYQAAASLYQRSIGLLKTAVGKR
ncbi:MAG: flagellar basal body rod protein FlgB [Alphaproteobacteria bacterium]|nr:flagellar basal body rod protein FlgB [Alphaproteobacteria bacterium]